MQQFVSIEELDAEGLDNLAERIHNIERHLGALRAEYMSAEAKLLTDLSQIYDMRDSLLTQIARRYVEGKQGKWAYDASRRALVQEE